jgi:hypothetical protein
VVDARRAQLQPVPDRRISRVRVPAAEGAAHPSLAGDQPGGLLVDALGRARDAPVGDTDLEHPLSLGAVAELVLQDDAGQLDVEPDAQRLGTLCPRHVGRQIPGLGITVHRVEATSTRRGRDAAPPRTRRARVDRVAASGAQTGERRAAAVRGEPHVRTLDRVDRFVAVLVGDRARGRIVLVADGPEQHDEQDRHQQDRDDQRHARLTPKRPSPSRRARR